MRQSRIIGVMNSHAGVTPTRQLAGISVAECANADVRRVCVSERARMTMAIFHPGLRDELSACAESLGR
ncbi:MAG: hypothetical protein HKL85_09935 [Acidimicrobiaceae bacterium]|nr:hypothetical protein [Acidimicrobiaceae bacterium]